MMSEPVLEAHGLDVAFRQGAGALHAVRGVDLSVQAGETLALVGESGCGKSMTALALAGLLPAGASVVAGQIRILGQDMTSASERQWRGVRGDRLGMVFQDPMSALNPVLTVGEQIAEAVLAHRRATRREAWARAKALIAQVHLPDGERLLGAYPHQLSGGMRQRVSIAIAIANEPRVLIADEPTTALDATVQEGILSLLHELQSRMGMALVLITHDLAVVGRWADRVAVMYAGRKVEERTAADLLHAPAHPYTRALIRARPSRRPPTGLRPPLAEIPGIVPPLGTPLPGCAFASRCTLARDLCHEQPPAVRALAGGHVRCHAVGHDWPVPEARA